MDDDGTDIEGFPRVPSIDIDDDLDAILEVSEDDPPTPNQPPRRSLSMKQTSSFTSVPMSEEGGSPLGESFVEVAITAPPFVDIPIPDEEEGISGGFNATGGVCESIDIDNSNNNNDIEELRARACALASVPIPDYADAFKRKNKKYNTKKYRDKVLGRNRRDKDPNSIVLASKTSNILAEFQDYITEIEEEPSGKDILEYAYVGEVSAASPGGGGVERGLVAREWTYDETPEHELESDLTKPIRRRSRDIMCDLDDFLQDHDLNDHGSTHSETNKERRSYYKNKLLHSKKFKVGMVAVTVFVVLVATIIGISTSGGKENVEEDLLERVEGLEMMPGEEDQEQEQGAAKEGEIIIPSPSDQDEVDADADAVAEKSISDQDEGDAESSIGSPINEKPDLAQYLIEEVIESSYNPQWFARATGWSGSTYSESIGFCISQTMVLCPYEAYCGTDNESLYQQGKVISNGGSEEQWSAVSDVEDGWVQVGPYDRCELYQDLHSKPPEWGVDGKGGELVTEHILCCEASDSNDVEEASHDDTPAVAPDTPKVSAEDALLAAALKYKPRHFDRTKGWEGQTYADAIQFCGALEVEGYTICNYEAICPLGHDSEPLGGYTEGAHEMSWIPIADKANDWIQLSQKNDCVRYSSENSNPPELAGENDDDEDYDSTSNLMCCLGSETADESVGVVYEEIEEAYDPIAYTRDDGWEGQTYLEAVQFCSESEGYEICPYVGICPMGPGTKPFVGFTESNNGAWVPVSDAPNDWVNLSTEEPCVKWSSAHSAGPAWGMTGEGNEDTTRFILCCKGSIMGGAEESFLYQNAAEKYRPRWYERSDGWDGQTYDEADSFCISKESNLCPMEAYCPMAELDEPMGGVIDDTPNGSWAPISNAENMWVSVSGENTCMLYDNLYDEPAEWGVTGDGNEDITRHIMCCDIGDVSVEAVEQNTPPETNEEIIIYGAAMEKYKPREFDSTKGWEGKTYEDAIEFCSTMEGYGICRYEAICPLGHDTQPLGGYYKEGSHEMSWIPIADKANDWIQLSHENACIRYSGEHNEGPEWGIKGDEDGDLTSNIMCCLTIGTEGDEFAAYQDEVKVYEPEAYTRDDGWEGQTYLEAVQFCSESEGRAICPIEAICPMGPDTEPLGGYDEGNNGSWVPVSDAPNSWVSLTSEEACIPSYSVYPKGPEWGMTGEGNEEITRLIFCCKGSIINSAEESFLYQNAIKKYHPRWYERSDGWDGQTYDEADSFCISKALNLCPVEAYCPMAELDKPLGGVIDDTPNGSWAPISNAINGWVSVGSENTCMLYGVVNGEPAEWGVTGEGNEDITRHIMCCEIGGFEQTPLGIEASKPSIEPTHSPSPAPTIPPSKRATQPPTLLPTNQPTPPPTQFPSKKPTPAPVSVSESAINMDAYYSVLKYKPTWYSRSSGWTGQTYDEAFSFCSKQGPDTDLCPYSVYCPMGESTKPYGGTMAEPMGSWAPANDSFNEWVSVGSSNTCIRFSTINSSYPSWGLTGEENEEMTRHIMCCQIDNIEGDTSVPKEITSNTLDYGDVKGKYAPKWYHRDEYSSDGWIGKSYTDAISFCARMESSIPCPYEALCPKGPGSIPTEGARQARQAWAPIMDVPNGWVNVGSSSDSCELYTSIYPNPPLWGLHGKNNEEDLEGDVNVKDITADICCCREPPIGDTSSSLQSIVSSPVPIADTKYEQDILDKKHPIWFSRKHGYHGTTHKDAADFCRNIGDRVLCPLDTYCPEGSEKPLFLQKDAFVGEQWAPLATTDTRSSHNWMLVGTLDGESQSTCATFADVKGMKPTGWDVEDGDPELKENVLCCLNPNHLLKEVNFAKQLDRIWLDESFGWKGGSHDDANEFCKKLGNKQLCPYAAYCPHGPGQPVIGGHIEDFNMEGEQWAPVHHNSNYWVMIGQKYQNSATTCMDNWELEGHEPSWGLSDDRSDMKRHIMCCSL